MQWWSKYLGRVLGVPSLFRNFLGFFLYMENGVSRSCVHFPGAPSNSPAADPWGPECSQVNWQWTHGLMSRSGVLPFSLFISLDRVYGGREEGLCL